MKNIYLIHLHPDFDFQLREILAAWNISQNRMEFIGLRPAPKYERLLLSPGSISDDEASEVASTLRKDCKYNNENGVLIFTEKRLYDEEYYQLFVGGREADDDPPNVAIISLQYLRNAYELAKSEGSMLFRAILSNILYSLAIDAGLEDHNSQTKGCIMDFCLFLPDIKVGLQNGPKFCPECTEIIKRKSANYLLNLVDKIHSNEENIASIDKEITKTIMLRGESYKKDSYGFDYDVAISYAAKDLEYAEQLATELKGRGVKVFFDKFEKDKLWGTDLLISLKELYRLRAKFCVIFMSKNYIESKWTGVELRAALAREFEEDRDYILPIKLDGTEVNGILPTKGYIDWFQEGLKNICEIIISKLETINYSYNSL